MLAESRSTDLGDGPLSPEVALALLRSGNYVAAAVSHEELVGLGVACFSTPLGVTMRALVTGVARGHGDLGVGTALMAHQRHWALSRGLRSISWTFDPLVARDAYLSLHRLDAEVVDYLTDETWTSGASSPAAGDRLVVCWRIDGPLREPTAAGDVGQGGRGADVVVLEMDQAREPSLRPGPPPAEARWCRVAVPDDVTVFLPRHPALVDRWRGAVRLAFQGLLADGWTVADFDRSRGYTFRRSGPRPRVSRRGAGPGRS